MVAIGERYGGRKQIRELLMIHTEQIAVFELSSEPDYYGGIYETYVPAIGAPTWATIRQTSGNQIAFMSAGPQEKRFDIEVNQLETWTWQTGHIIDSRFGYISVDSISEDTRKRTLRLTGNIIQLDNFPIA